MARVYIKDTLKILAVAMVAFIFFSSRKLNTAQQKLALSHAPDLPPASQYEVTLAAVPAPPVPSKRDPDEIFKRDPDEIFIVFWYIVKRGIQGQFAGKFNFSGCPYKCSMTTKKEYFREADVLIMNYNKDLPPERTPHQKWMFYGFESPRNTIFPPERQWVFNESFTYKRNSNVPNIQYEFVPRDQVNDPWDSSNITMYNPYGHKKKLAVKLASNHCTAYSKRGFIIEILQRYMPIDYYGDCGTLRCNSSRGVTQRTTWPWNPCLVHLRQNYLFYMAFENALCEDYITEKLMRTVDMGMVPVVYGGLRSSEYSDIMPPHSYINAEDYKTPQELAQYLQYLADNPVEYMKYFEWNKQYKFQYKTMETEVCSMCEYFHQTKNDPPKAVDGLAFFSAETNCREASLWSEYYSQLKGSVEEDAVKDSQKYKLQKEQEELEQQQGQGALLEEEKEGQ